ncbi:universal stress protein [Ulvibacterium sp.]|uniref:universal stress protein n=1 Tax=Ulvibacterium sp. TaxID=2665914 RepID=UPI003CC68CEA
MKTILYATDYSENSVDALKYAYALCRDLKIRLVMTHIYDVPTVLGTQLTASFPSLSKDARRHEREKLQVFFKKNLGKVSDTMKLHFEPMEHMSVIRGIISKATEWHAYLIFVGMKGEGRLREILMGSTTKSLIEKAPCPVLAIPENTNYKPFKTVVYATDFEEEDVYAIRKLTEMVRTFQAEIKVVHIITEKEYQGETQMEWFRDMLQNKVTYEKIAFKLLFSDDIFEALRMYLEDVGAELMVMLEREKKGLLKKWFHRDLVKKMESYGQVPLMSFRDSNHQLFYFSTAL